MSGLAKESVRRARGVRYQTEVSNFQMYHTA